MAQPRSSNDQDDARAARLPAAPFEAACVSTNDSVRELLRRVVTYLDDNGAAESLTETAEMVLAEAMNNIVEHAYKWRDTGQLRLWVALQPAAVEVALSDDGESLPGRKLPCKRQHDLNVALEDLPEGGFGWFLIHSLASDLTYRRDDNGNHLRFRLLQEAG